MEAFTIISFVAFVVGFLYLILRDNIMYDAYSSNNKSETEKNDNDNYIYDDSTEDISSSSYSSDIDDSSSLDDDILTDPVYCHLPGNIYHSICEDDNSMDDFLDNSSIWDDHWDDWNNSWDDDYWNDDWHSWDD